MPDPEETLDELKEMALVAVEKAPAAIEIELLVALRVPSLAVMVFVPAVFRVREKEPVPFTRVAVAGRVARESEEVIATEPA